MDQLSGRTALVVRNDVLTAIVYCLSLCQRSFFMQPSSWVVVWGLFEHNNPTGHKQMTRQKKDTSRRPVK